MCFTLIIVKIHIFLGRKHRSRYQCVSLTPRVVVRGIRSSRLNILFTVLFRFCQLIIPDFLFPSHYQASISRIIPTFHRSESNSGSLSGAKWRSGTLQCDEMRDLQTGSRRRVASSGYAWDENLNSGARNRNVHLLFSRLELRLRIFEPLLGRCLGRQVSGA